MKFLDRQAEMRRLVRLHEEGRGGFVAVWGRRRIGKSELMKAWCRATGGLYAVADRSLSAVQRQDFAQLVESRFTGFSAVTYPTWKSLFDELARRAAAEKWHGPVVFDEFPYWVEADASIVSVLQNWIDGEKAKNGLLVAIAGSSQHMMQGLVIDSGSPLYGRCDERIRLPPLEVGFIREGLRLRDPLDAVRAYSIWGGVPRYWVAVERYGRNLDDALDEQALDPLGLFHDEPATILQSEIPTAISLKPYLDVIGSGARRVSEIAGRLGVSATALSKPLARLLELGLVSREVPYGESEKSSKKSLYRVCDPFCRFWFKVIASRRSVLDSAPAAIRKSIWQAQSNALFAEGWEDLARAFVAQSPQLMALAGDGDYWRPAGRWWQGTAHELDVVSFNGAGTRTLMGEVKWSHRAFLRREVESLAKAFASIPVPPGFPQDVTRVLFLSSVARDVPRQVEGLEVLTAADVLPTTRPARA